MRLRRSRKPSPGQVATVLAKEIVACLHRHPFHVKHEIIRNVPKPAGMTMVFMDSMGRNYNIYIDMSYKSNLKTAIPVSFITGRDEDISLQAWVRIDLHYDPAGRDHA